MEKGDFCTCPDFYRGEIYEIFPHNIIIPLRECCVTTHREVSHPEGEDVGEAGDGDGDPGVSHGLRDDLTDRPGLLTAGPLDVVETLNYHEHVVDTDTWN